MLNIIYLFSVIGLFPVTYIDLYRLETCSGDPITPIDYFPTWNDFSGVL